MECSPGGPASLTRRGQNERVPTELQDIDGLRLWTRRLMRAKVLERSGMRYEDIKKKTGVLWLHSTSFHEQMRRFSIPELREAFTVMLFADRKLKSSGMGGRLVLERMILQLCGA